MAGHPNFIEPLEETFTHWHNPLEVEQYVDIREGDNLRPTRFRVPPGGTTRISSRHDSVVQRVHNGVIIGGQAPQLVRVGGTDQLDPALDTEQAKRREAEARHAQAELQRQTAERNAAIAAADVGESDKKLQNREAKKPALPPEHGKKPSDGG